MKHTHSRSMTVLAVAVLFSCSLCLGGVLEGANQTLTDFSNPLIGTQWVSVNDGVMGGVSKGSFRITKDETLEFFGTLSLENQGGFASIRSRPADLQLGAYDTLAVRVKGDGRTYNLNLRSSSRNAAGSYRAPFTTQKNTWQVVRIPFEDFNYTAYGRRIAGTGPIQADKIQSVGFTLSDKQAGPFNLEVDWIRAEDSAKAIGESPKTQAQDSKPDKDLVDTAVAAGNFNTLVAAVKAAGLVDALRAEGPLTVFAPSDEAFAKLPEGTVASLLKPENRETLIAILTYHVLPGEILLEIGRAHV